MAEPGSGSTKNESRGMDTLGQSPGRLSQGTVNRASSRNLFTLRIRLVAGTLLLAVISILLLALAGRLWPDNHLLFIFLIGLFAILLAALIWNAFTRPLSHLTKAAERIILGDLWSQVPVTQDEFGALANSLNTMTTELRRIQADMEATIAQQAAELANTSEQMRIRANQFRAITEVTQAIAGEDAFNNDPEALLNRVAELISSNFGFYYVGIYLVDKTGQWAVLQATNMQGRLRPEAVDDRQQPMPAPGDKLDLKGGGLIGEVIRSGETRYIVRPDRHGLPRHRTANPEPASATAFETAALTQLPYTRSEIVLPLKASAHVIGAVDIQSIEHINFSEQPSQEEYLATLSTLAGQVAIAVENARLFREYSFSLTEIQTLHRQTLQEAWARVVNERKSRGYIYHKGKLSSLAGDQGYQARAGQDIPTSEAGMVVPIIVRGQVIGMLNLGEPGQGRGWTEEEISLVKTVADQIGLAMENARLLEETQRRAEREHLVSEITTRLRSSNDPDAILQTAASELRKALGAARTQILSPSEKQMDGKQTGSGNGV